MRIARYDDGSCSLLSDESELLMSLENSRPDGLGIVRLTGDVGIEALYSLLFARILEEEYPTLFKTLTRMLTPMMLSAYNSAIERR